MYMCLKCQRHEPRILLFLLTRSGLRSMSRCVNIYKLAKVLMYMCLKCQRHERRILLGLLSRGRLRSMSRCVCIHTLPFHLDIGATVHVSQVSETRTQDVVGITNSESGVTEKYVTVCVCMYTHIPLPCVHRC